MISLPPALRPWADELALFPAEIAGALAPLLPRVHRLVGALRASPKNGLVEPDGFDGLSRRGLYDRLLLSEWLLADEEPLEFARRAATGEHAFLKIASREPQSAPLSVAVFDAGPNQLGAPRLAHLAALIVLFRRAQNSGAHFRWGVLQDENAPHDTLTSSNIRALLQARSSREATIEDWNRWRETVQAMRVFHASPDAPDAWIIGGERLQRALPLFERTPVAQNPQHRVLDSRDAAKKLALSSEISVSLLRVHESDFYERENDVSPTQNASSATISPTATSEETDLELAKESSDAARALLLSVVTRENWQTNPREIALDLPDAKSAARLLRDPFAVATAETQNASSRFSSQGNLLWASATKLMARSIDGSSLVVLPVANSPRAGTGKPRIYRPDNRGEIVAAGRARKAVVVITQIDAQTLAVQAWGKSSDSVPQGRFKLPFPLPESRDQTLLPCAVVPNSSPLALLVLLPGRKLAKLTTECDFAQENCYDATRVASYENQNCLALQARSDDVVFVTANRGIVQLRNAEKTDARKFNREIQTAFFGRSEKSQDAGFGLVAVQLRERDWLVPSQVESNNPFDRYWAWSLESSTRIVGVMNLYSWATPALVAIENEREVVLRGDNWEQNLFSAGAPIEHASVSPFSPDIAIRTAAGEIAVWSVAHKAWTLRLAPDSE